MKALHAVFAGILAAALLCGCQTPPDKPPQPSVEIPAPAESEKQPDRLAELKEKIDALVLQLGSEDYHTREAADKELKKLLLQDTDNFDFILSRLKHHLDTTPEPEVKTRLERIMKPHLRLKDLVKALDNASVEIRRKAAEALASINDAKAIEPLVKALGDEDCLVERRPSIVYGVRYIAAKALAKKGEAAVEPLIKALSHENPEVRRIVVSILGEIGDKKAVEPLVKALHDNDAEVRWCSAFILGKLKDPKAVDPLIRAAGDPAPQLRRAAVGALRNFSSEKGWKIIIKALCDKDEGVRRAAADILAGKRRHGSIALAWALRDTDARIRLAAVELLGQLAHWRFVSPAVKALNDEDKLVRAAAEDALIKIGKEGLSVLKGIFEKEKDEAKKAKLKEIMEKIGEK